ncbi:hypothetical protein [Clostridium butyricum]|uniref:hypothetical protein n=1 Tax=Clostridium butyricum TaxID=1492 RepID=UPI002ABDAEB4|nr:hypothetical protein [Clostridium butyricum]
MTNTKIINDIIQLFHNSSVNIFIVLLVLYLFEIDIRNKLGIQAFKYQQNLIRYFSSCFLILQISLDLYYILTKFCNSILLDSGLLLIPWLVITGIVINIIYEFIISNLSYKSPLKNDSEKLFIISSMGILASTTMIFYNLDLALTTFSIILGRFLWIDTGINGLTDLYSKLKLQLVNLFEFPTHRSIPKKTFILFLVVTLANVSNYYIYPKITSPLFKGLTSFPVITLLSCLIVFSINRNKK